jgi:hypothetical protein
MPVRNPNRKDVFMRSRLIVGLAMLAACSKSSPAGPAGVAGGLVITIGPAPAGTPGCYTFSPDSAVITVGQPVQWRNTIADSVSLQVAETVFLTVPPNQLSFPQTNLGGFFYYGPISCSVGLDSSYATVTVNP